MHGDERTEGRDRHRLPTIQPASAAEQLINGGGEHDGHSRADYELG